MESLSTPKLSKGQKTAIKILEAAAMCISKQGIEKTSVTNIALEADIKRSLVAYHFPKKSEVIYKVVELIVGKNSEYSSEATQNKYGHDGLEAMFNAYLEFYQERPHYFHVMLHFYYLASIDDRARRINTQITNRIVNRVKTHLAQILLPLEVKLGEKEMNFYCQGLVTWIIGVIMNSQCVENNISPKAYRTRFTSQFNREIELLVGSLKNSKKV